MSFTTPILLIFFNRLETVEQVIESIRKAQPSKLFLAADGPRSNVKADIENCRKTRELVDSMIDWDCKVHRLYSDENLGCGRGPASAITWFFNHVEEGIVLEDDCVPLASFYPFCQELLEKYRKDDDVMHISGTTFFDNHISSDSYFYSKFSIGWGWATWKRAWAKFSYEILETQEEIKCSLTNHLNANELKYWIPRLMQLKYYNEDDIWDVQWSYTILKNKAYGIIPSKNLVDNIGFSEEATHTKEKLFNNDYFTSDIHKIKHPNVKFFSNLWENHPFQTQSNEIAALSSLNSFLLKKHQYIPI